MNETNLSLSTSQKLQPFILLSKSVKGVANTKLIMDALNANGVYVFTELYESPNVVEVSGFASIKHNNLKNILLLSLGF
jgi:COP9 signalosome complex subunit 7